MKKLNKIITILSLILLVMFSGCGQDTPDNKVDDSKGSDIVVTNDSSEDEPVSQDDSGLDENIIEDEEVEIGELI